MRPLTNNEIHTLWQEKADMELEEAPILVEDLSAAQPSVLTYLLATGDDILTEEERQVTFFMGVLIWFVVQQSVPTLIPEITTDELLEQEENNFKMLEYLAGEPDTEFMTTVAKIMDSYNQRNLLQYVIDRIMEEPEKEVELNDNHLGMMVIYLKTFIDCLDSAIP